MANSPILAIPLLSTSQAAKETTINTMVSYLERAMNDTITINFAGGNYVLPLVDLQRYFNFKLTGAGGSSVLTITATKRMFALDNLASGGPVTLDCGSDTLVIPAGGVVIVLCDGTNLISVADSTVMGGGGGVTNFLGLTDTPNSYASAGNRVVRVKNDLTGLEFHPFALNDLAGINLTGIDDGYVLAWNEADSRWDAVPLPTGGSGSAYWKDPVTVATTANVDLSSDLSDGEVIDGIVLEEGMRVLVKNQTNPIQNGIYDVNIGAATRSTDADEAVEFLQGTAVAVVLGDVNGQSIFIQTEELVVVGSSPITFSARGNSLANLEDVDLSTSPTDGQVLTWDGDLSRWVAETPSGGGGGGGAGLLVDLGDVEITSPTDGQVLTWDAGTSKWVAENAGGATPSLNDLTDVVAPSPTNGQVLKFNGTNWVPATDEAGGTVLVVSTKTGSYSLVLADAGGYIRMDVATANVLTVPANSSQAFPIGTVIQVRQVGIGQTTIMAAAGVTITTSETLLLRKAGATCSLVKVGINTWDLTGDMELA